MNLPSIEPGQSRRYTEDGRKHRAEIMRRVLREHREKRIAVQRANTDRKKIPWKCEHCGKEEMKSPADARDSKFCGIDCAKAGLREKLGPPPEAGKTSAEIYRWRYVNDPQFRAATKLRKYLHKIIRRRMESPATIALVGCTTAELRAHLERQFKPGMNWENSWHVDHIVPICRFDLLNHEQRRTCFHFTNLQPLWGSENSRKHTKIL